jgi:integrase/recombinase XerD
MKWEAKAIVHKNEKRIAVWFDNNPDSNARIKKLPQVKWIKTLGAWHIPDTLRNRVNSL